MTPFQRKLAQMLNARIHKALQENDIDRCEDLHALACEIEFQVAMDSTPKIADQFMDEVTMNCKDYI